MATAKFLREDKSGKVDYSYIPELLPVFDRIMARFELGSRKYARLNWRNANGPEHVKDLQRSLIRHTLQYLAGHQDDQHLDAVVLNAVMLMDLEEQHDSPR